MGGMERSRGAMWCGVRRGAGMISQCFGGAGMGSKVGVAEVLR